MNQTSKTTRTHNQIRNRSERDSHKSSHSETSSQQARRSCGKFALDETELCSNARLCCPRLLLRLALFLSWI
jgi:hypothetical protein